MLSNQFSPIVAIATASGRGAVGIVRVSGVGIDAVVQALCGRVLKPREATYLPFSDGMGGVIDHGLAIYFPQPHSYTGEDVLELQAHGGSVVLQLLLARCLQAGQAAGLDLRLAQPGEFTQRAFLNGKMDLAQAEAVADLIDASTEAAARSASRSLGGAFSAEVQVLLEALIHLRMLVEATLDFPEEEIDFLQKADAVGQLSKLQQTLAKVLAHARQGALLREGLKVVIAGQPNAGKSSLLNALAGAELAIVTPIAGTTRDVVAQTIQIEGVPVHVVDTAGLRESTDEVEKMGIARAWGQIEAADAVLFLHDLTRQAQPQYVAEDMRLQARLAELLPSRVPVVAVWNKLDAAEVRGQDVLQEKDGHAKVPVKRESAADGGIAISAKTGEGLETLRRRLLDIAGWQSGGEGVYIARERHVQALRAVDAHLMQASVHLHYSNEQGAQALDLLAEELRLAQNTLSSITGAFGVDDLLGVIFSKFCIGK